MKKGIIISGFTALGKTTLAEKYENIIDFYLAYPKLDSGDVIKERCIKRGNSEEWSQAIKDKVILWYPRLEEYNIKNIIFVDKAECLEDVLVRMKLI